ncbi:Small nuclear ribonucleoprotein [Nosema bombycis CQ1]|uniref:Small nuclear ribonucleoprotein n=1 Tax=Nosema bombycis (strain CQ1 / CVCC 102059) TaxID=578461 RepID=R0KMY0_NOSB1|nr:Small nuclear ribonucleoprotein [Nosema bombycis CQ1]|eukprot:EOB12006.1 Small nuclear ribonucleoprotein [Nosema bombycis CQ1]
MKLSDIPNVENFLDKKVKIEITGGTVFIGTLKGYDGFVNVVLQNVTKPLYTDSQVVIKGKEIKSLDLIE